jgi:hypothetical protein
MLRVLLLCSGCFTISPSDEDLAAYRAAQATVGRDAGAHVRLAQWCESRGLLSERRKHLAMAVLIDPDHPAARGLLGQVPDDGQWRKPEEVADHIAKDAELGAKLAEYDARRGKASPKDADDQWELALWCQGQGLKDEATAHFAAVTRLDPSREAAWKRLGYRRQNGRWVTAERVAAEKADRELQDKADARWLPALQRWKGMLGEKSPQRRSEAEQALADLEDPRAVPSIWRAFATGRAADQTLAVRLLGQVDAPTASRALATLAVYSESAEVRRKAAETLRRRDAREFAWPLIALLRDPIKYEVRPVNGPGSTGVLFVEGQRFNIQRLYEAPALPPQFRFFQDTTPFDPFGPLNMPQGNKILPYRWRGNSVAGLAGSLRVFGPASPQVLLDTFTLIGKQRDYQIGLNMMEVQRAAISAERQLEQDVARIEAFNAEARRINGRVGTTLDDATSANLGEDRDGWLAWWSSQLGYFPRSSTNEKPTIVQDLQFANLDPSTSRPVAFTSSCFGAGTLVRTLEGLRPIEDLAVGDRVLAQDVKSGLLDFRPILAVLHNPPSKTFGIRLGGEAITSSTFHRFWKAGHGWVMARDLKVGDPIRTLSGLATVTAIEPEKVQPVFNLDVAEDHSFFVGRGGALVHDHTVPGLRLEPFDAPMAVARGETTGTDTP